MTVVAIVFMSGPQDVLVEAALAVVILIPSNIIRVVSSSVVAVLTVSEGRV